MRLLLLLTAAGSALQRPMATLRQTAHGLAAKTVAREDATTSRLLALEAERRELQARLAANEERQRALALGKDVEPKPPRVLKKSASSSCEASPTVWSDECDIDYDVEDSSPALAPDESTTEFLLGAASRGSWLVGLLAAQSLSSLVLEANEVVIQKHPVIVFFLTMLCLLYTSPSPRDA